VSEEIDALGNSTVYGYDAAGRLQTITDATLNATTTFERDAAGRVTKTTDALTHETHTTYKSGGRLASTTNARGKTTTFNRTPTSASITDALTRTTVTSLTTYGLPQATVHPGGADTSSSYLGATRLDGAQQFPTSFEDELNRTRNYGYDTKSGLTSATDLAGQQWQYQYTAAAGSGVSYDVMSGAVSTAHQDGGASAYQSSGGGTEYRDVATTGGGDGGNFTHMLSQVTSPMGEVTKFERGTNGRISKVTYPDGGTRTISYDAVNRPQTIVLPQGTVVNLSHDALGRETSRTTSTGEFRNLTYGVGDRIETMEDNTGTTTYSYDQAGRFSGIMYPTGASVMYTRDKLDRTTDVRVKPSLNASEIVTHYDYDENGNLAQITDPNGGVTGFQYDNVDRLQQRILPNGVVTTYGYDSRDRVLSVVHKNASNLVLASVTYVRSPSGEPSKITREDNSYVDIEYDAALRVSKESECDANGTLIAETTYGYDSDGNRTSKTTLTGSDTYSYAAGFKLTSVSHSGGGADDQFGYDGGGRVTSITRGGTTKTLEYDSFDHITKVTEGGIERVRYTFDGDGRRVTADDGTGVKRFLSAPAMGVGLEGPQAVTDGAGNLIATFVYSGGDSPFMKITPAGAEYALTDSAGSTIAKADAFGFNIATIRYDAFGGVTSSLGSSASIDSSIGSESRFQGMQLDTDTGLYFVRARTYDPNTGRFVSMDPLVGVRWRPETYYPYVFANSNPLIFSDPNGKEFNLLEITAVSAVVTVLSGLALTNYSKYLRVAEGLKAGTLVASNAASDQAAGLAQIEKDLGNFVPGSQQEQDYLDAVWRGIYSSKHSQINVTTRQIVCNALAQNPGDPTQAFRDVHGLREVGHGQGDNQTLADAEHYLWSYSWVAEDNSRVATAYILAIGYQTGKFYFLADDSRSLGTWDNYQNGVNGVTDAFFGVDTMGCDP
jgi:RHS repeat-associated protein